MRLRNLVNFEGVDTQEMTTSEDPLGYDQETQRVFTQSSDNVYWYRYDPVAVTLTREGRGKVDESSDQWWTVPGGQGILSLDGTLYTIPDESDPFELLSSVELPDLAFAHDIQFHNGLIFVSKRFDSDFSANELKVYDSNWALLGTRVMNGKHSALLFDSEDVVVFTEEHGWILTTRIPLSEFSR